MKHEETSPRSSGCVVKGQKLRTGVPNESALDFLVCFYMRFPLLFYPLHSVIQNIFTLLISTVLRTVQLIVSVYGERPRTTQFFYMETQDHTWRTTVPDYVSWRPTPFPTHLCYLCSNFHSGKTCSVFLKCSSFSLHLSNYSIISYIPWLFSNFLPTEEAHVSPEQCSCFCFCFLEIALSLQVIEERTSISSQSGPTTPQTMYFSNLNLVLSSQ